jgi:glycine/D-amino acid oxidase-like deaminating enzyme
MLSDAERMGEDKMWEIVEMRFKGIQKIRQHFTDNVIDYSNCGGFECFAWQERELYDKLDWLNDGMKKITGTSNVFTWSDDKLLRFGFAGFSGMIENKMEGGLHSGKLLLQLSRKVQSLGVNILTGMEVIAFEKQNNYIDIVTRYARIQAGKLLVCTNAFSSNLVKDLCIEPARGQVLVTEPIENLKMRGTFHYDQGYYYFRNVGDRVLIGGARNTDFTAERTDELVVSEQIQIELERFVSSHLLPGIPYKVSHRWSGIMGFSENKLPVVREVEENVYTALSCNGMGGCTFTGYSRTGICIDQLSNFNDNQLSTCLFLFQ